MQDSQTPPVDSKPPVSQWTFTTGDADQLPPETAEVAPDDRAVQWTASEFIAHHKTAGWYVVFIVSVIVLDALIYLLTSHDLVSTAVVPVAALLFGITANRKPRTLAYEVAPGGFKVGSRSYVYGTFKSFSVVQEGAFSSIVFLPLKRFALPVMMYYAQEDENRIVSLLSSYLPIEPPHDDVLDNLLRRIRF